MMETDTETRVKTGFLRTLRIYMEQQRRKGLGKDGFTLEKGYTTRQTLSDMCKGYAKALGKRG